MHRKVWEKSPKKDEEGAVARYRIAVEITHGALWTQMLSSFLKIGLLFDFRLQTIKLVLIVLWNALILF
jgi:hypothetical protein